ncbi:hypothetical protein AgCh_024996 [Apium graveolens]
MDKMINVRLHYDGQFQKASYVGGKSMLVTRMDVERFSYTILIEFVKDYRNFSEIGGIYISKGKRGGWNLLLDDKDVLGCENDEEIHFYIDNTIDLDIEPACQMQPHVKIRARKNIIEGSAKKQPGSVKKQPGSAKKQLGSAKKQPKRKYTTTHGIRRKEIVKSKKARTNREAGPTTRSQANAVVSSDVIVTAIKKQPNKDGNKREATSSFNPPVLKPTCSKMFKQSDNHEKAGSVSAYLAMRERQKQNLAAPTMKNVPELGQEGMETEEVETSEDNAARRNTITETHTMGPRTYAQAKEKLKKKDLNIAKPSDAEIYLETYKREPGRTYKTDIEELRTKYRQVQELVNAGNIVEANALVHGGKLHGRNWLVGRKGKKPINDMTYAAPSDQYVQKLSTKIKQDLESDLEAQVNAKVQENMSWMLKKLGEANPSLNSTLETCVPLHQVIKMTTMYFVDGLVLGLDDGCWMASNGTAADVTPLCVALLKMQRFSVIRQHQKSIAFEHLWRSVGITTMADSFIPVPAYHSEPSVGGPSSDPRPVVPPVLVILPPNVAQPVPLRAIPPPGMRPPIRGPPPADSDSTGHSVAGPPFQSTLHHVPYYRYEALLLERDSLLAQIRELQHIIRTTDVYRGVTGLREEIHVTRRVLEAGLRRATLAGPDAFMGWASENEETNNNNQDNTNQNANPGPIDPAVAQILQILTQQTVHLTQQQQRRNNPQVTFKTFQAVNPPEFKGSLDPIEANVWLKEIEKSFALVKVKQEQKVEYGSYYLKNEATYWWETVKTLEGTDAITWKRFKELFLEKYFPQFVQDQMELKFVELKRGNMSVADYESKFEELSRYVPSYVDTDRKKAKRFQQGLKPLIRGKVAIFELDTYVGVVQKAMIAETESEMSWKEKESKKRKFQGNEGQSQPGKFSSFKKGIFQPVNVNQPNQLRLTFPDFQVCGKKHRGVCNKLNVVCFKYNQKGHYSRECHNQPVREPVNKDQSIRNPVVKVPAIGFTCFKCGKPGHIARDCKTPALVSNALRIMGSTPVMNETPRARVFDMFVKDAIQDTDVVAVTLNVNSLCAKVLIDSGATRSFISQDFVSKLNYSVEYLNEIMTVKLANQERTSVNQVCGNCEIEISGNKFCLDLIPFKLGEFEVILGMDWLSKHDA